MSVRHALLVLALAGCTRERPAPPPAREAPAFEVTRTDDLGRKVHLTREPLRIVSLLPSHTETLFALGIGERVVGRDRATDWPPEARALPEVGHMLEQNVEAILALKPDLVLCGEYGAQATTLERAGLPTFAGTAQRYEEIFPTMRTLGALVNRAREADALVARVEADVRAIEAEVAARPRVSVYYEIDATPYTVGPRSFVGVLLAKAGGDNVVPEALGEFPKIAPELVVAADPEVVLGVSLDEARRRPGWARLRAVRSGRVEALPPGERELVTRPGPRVADALRVFARRLHSVDAGGR